MTTDPFPLATFLTQLQRVALIARLPNNLPVQELIEIGDALLAAPLFVVEVMAEGADGLAAIAEFRRRYGDHLLVGAVVATLPQLEAAVTAGAHFFTLPMLDPKILRFAREERLFCLPQVKTPVAARLAHLEGCPVAAIAAPDLLAVAAEQWPTTIPLVATGVDDGAVATACRRAGAVAIRLQEALFPATEWSHAEVITAARRWRHRWEGRGNTTTDLSGN
jgi:2-keto-3-deoxy-6-phosphogluconate aldolase